MEGDRWRSHLREHLGFIRAVDRQVDAHHLIRLRAHEDALVLGPGIPADGAHLMRDAIRCNQRSSEASQQTART